MDSCSRLEAVCVNRQPDIKFTFIFHFDFLSSKLVNTFLEIKIWFSSVLYTKIRPDDIFYIGPINLSTLL